MDISDAVAEIDGSMPRTRLGSIPVRGGTIFWLGVALLCLAAIALMCFRPARVVGVSDKALAYSLRGAVDGGETGACEKVEHEWRCRVLSEDFGGGSFTEELYSVDVSDWGCWEATRSDGKGGEGGALPESLDGCITVADLIRIGD